MITYIECVKNTAYEKHVSLGSSYIIIESHESTYSILSNKLTKVRVPKSFFILC